MVVVVSLRSQSTVGLVNLAWQDLIAVVAVIKVKGGVYHGGRDAWSTGLKFPALLCACTARSGVCEDQDQDPPPTNEHQPTEEVDIAPEEGVRRNSLT